MRVLLVPNAANPRSVDAVREVAAWLAAQDAGPFLVAEDAAACGLEGFGVPASEVGEPELTVALGGDGTVLKAVHLLGEVERPVLGVNLGRLGFMCGADADGMREAITSALAGEIVIERRTTLAVQAWVGGRESGTFRALNEVHVGRGPSGRAVEIAVCVDGVEVERFLCDGVIIATPTGSTAYALSAGGPLLAPDLAGFAIVPVAAHALACRPLVVGPSATVELVLPNPARSEGCFAVDGDSPPCRLPLERLTASRGATDVLLARLDSRGFYEALRDSFFGG
ncbi:MAG: hypothetical protein C0418_04385 [Coriobacteriaceae bacterium]|nr:hypothetical protein [Coriobacteriaceae bacterium]